MQEDINTLKGDIRELSKDMASVKSTMQDIYQLLKGNPLRKEDGIVIEIEDHEERLTAIEDQQRSWKSWAIGATSTSVISLIVFLYKYLFDK